MKKLLLFMSLTLFVNADLTVAEIQKMVNKIHEKREGIELETLNSTQEPFVRLEEENNITTYIIPVKVDNTEAKLILHAIVNNKAYINDGWLNIDDKILGYSLKFIGKRGVVLRNDNHIKKLYLKKQRDNFITLEER